MESLFQLESGSAKWELVLWEIHARSLFEVFLIRAELTVKERSAGVGLMAIDNQIEHIRTGQVALWEVGKAETATAISSPVNTYMPLISKLPKGYMVSSVEAHNFFTLIMITVRYWMIYITEGQGRRVDSM